MRSSDGSGTAGSGSVVSSDAEELILVDETDEEVGFATKGSAHDGDGVLHRAFSIFLQDQEGRILLQRRASGKRLWPGFWANSCCSHPRRGESMELATQRRIQQELGVSVQLEYVYKFQYHARFGSLGSERELCWVYLGTLAGDGLAADGAGVRPNSTEVEEICWMTPSELDREIADHPDRFTPWLQLEWARLRDRLLG